MGDYVITNHAYENAWKRLKWSHDTMDRMLHKILSDGYDPKDTHGKLYDYLASKRKMYPNASAKIYGEIVYFFDDNRLVTLYQLPTALVKYVKYIREKS